MSLIQASRDLAQNPWTVVQAIILTAFVNSLFYLNSDQWQLNIIKHEHSWTWEPSQYVFKQILPWLLMWENLWPSLCKTSSTTQCLLCMCVCVSVMLCVSLCLSVCLVVCVSVRCLKSVPQIGSLRAGISPTRISLHTQTGPCWCQIQDTGEIQKYRNADTQSNQLYTNTHIQTWKLKHLNIHKKRKTVSRN